jgi:hypothetical protein
MGIWRRVRQHDRVAPSEYVDELEALLEPAAVLTRADVLTRPCPVPGVSGVYGWHFNETPPRVPSQGCRDRCGSLALCRYLAEGTTQRRPPGQPPDPAIAHPLPLPRQRVRIDTAPDAGLPTQPTTGHSAASSRQRPTDDLRDDESIPSDWMARRARVCWTATPTPGYSKADSSRTCHNRRISRRRP